MDEVKRALEVAERIPFRYLVQHLGHSHDKQTPRAIDAAFNSLEHLSIFAKERGVTIALENTRSEFGSPEALVQLIRETHLRELKFCFDAGHAHMEEGIPKALELMGDRIVTTHIHDNHGEKDEHLLPFEGTIDWEETLSSLAGLPEKPAIVLELKEQPTGKPTLDQIHACFDESKSTFPTLGRNPHKHERRYSGHHFHRASRRIYRARSYRSRLALQHARIGQAAVSHFSRRHRRDAGRCFAQRTSGGLRGAERIDPGIERFATGKIQAEPRAPGGYEMHVSAIEVVQRVSESEPYPIQLKEHGVDFLLDQRHLWIRTPRQAAILRIRAEAQRAARNFMDSQGYTLTDAPIFTPAACEGTTTLFEVNYIDDQKAYLTQSGQLYVEATAAALGKVYTFGPTFRAEKSKTRRHLTEFWMLEPEAAYAHLEDMMQLGEGLVSAIVQARVEKSRARTRRAAARRRQTRKDHASVSAHQLQRSRRSAAESRQSHQVGRRFRRRRRNHALEEFRQARVIHRYPSSMKAFYMAPRPAASRTGA